MRPPLYTIESPSGTIVWRKRLAGAGAVPESFEHGELELGKDAAVVFRVSAGALNCEVNGGGYQIGAS